MSDDGVVKRSSQILCSQDNNDRKRHQRYHVIGRGTFINLVSKSLVLRDPVARREGKVKSRSRFAERQTNRKSARSQRSLRLVWSAARRGISSRCDRRGSGCAPRDQSPRLHCTYHDGIRRDFVLPREAINSSRAGLLRHSTTPHGG